MKVIFNLYLILSIIGLLNCNTEEPEEGNILLPMSGTKLEVNLQGKKVGNKNFYTIK